ncbi:MAG: hypothetical protein IJJ66_01260, partial [Treponema sp.]|nr:hypothetical protein [Treponema sp.]MBR0475428.1 hypothetical protein [Treponema sp.]
KWLNKMLDKGEIERGDCVKTDLKLLFKFFKKKSEKTKYYGNYNDFEFALGQMYETGKGTLKSIWRAIKAYTNAHNYGNEKAITAIKRLGQTYPETKRLIEKMLNSWNAKK